MFAQACTIQRYWRGFAGLLRAIARREELEQQARATPEPALEPEPEPEPEPVHESRRSTTPDWAVLRVQARLRMRSRRREFLGIRSSAIRVQSYSRGWMARRRFRAWLRGATTAQRMWRGKVGRRKARCIWGECTSAAITIQSHVRAKAARRRAKRIRAAAVRIQAAHRGRRERVRYAEARRGCLRMLPDDLLEHVFMQLGEAASLSAARAACWRWNKVGRSEKLWRQLSTAHYGEVLAGSAAAAGGWRLSAVNMGRLSQVHWAEPGEGPGAALPPMLCERQGHTLTALSATQAVMLFGKDGPGTQGEHAMDAGSHYTLTASDTPGSACRMEWGELKVEAAGDWRRPTDEPQSPAARWGHTATLVEAGLVVVFGGFGAEEVMDDVWLLQIGAAGRDGYGPTAHSH